MNTDEAFLNWLAGFIDGEGCFLISQPKQRNTHVDISFALGLRDDDIDILEEIQQRLGIGTVRRFRRPGKPDHWGDIARWVVYSLNDCLTLAGLLEGRLRCA